MCGVLLDSQILNSIIVVNLRVNGCFSVGVSSVTDVMCSECNKSHARTVISSCHHEYNKWKKVNST